MAGSGSTNLEGGEQWVGVGAVDIHLRFMQRPRQRRHATRILLLKFQGKVGFLGEQRKLGALSLGELLDLGV